MLSYTCKTAIKAVIFLATKYDGKANSSIKEIAGYLNASEHTVGKMLQLLVKQEVINSLKGPSGGFYISKEQLTQPIINIIYAVDGKEIFKGCGLGLSKCSASRPCPIHCEYKSRIEALEKLFKTSRVNDLCKPVTNGLAYLYN